MGEEKSKRREKEEGEFVLTTHCRTVWFVVVFGGLTATGVLRRGKRIPTWAAPLGMRI